MLESSGDHYSGTFHVDAWVGSTGDDGLLLGTDVFSVTPSSPPVVLEISATQTGTYKIEFHLYNNVSKFIAEKSIAVAGVCVYE